MPSIDEALEQARGLYDSLGEEQKGKINRAVMTKINEVAGEPLKEIVLKLNQALQSSRSLAANINAMPRDVSAELTSLPEKLNIDHMAGPVPREILGVLEKIQTASGDPSTLFPLVKGIDYPVDPFKINQLAEEFGGEGGFFNTAKLTAKISSYLSEMQGQMGAGHRDISDNSSMFVTQCMRDFKDTAEPLNEALQKLDQIKEKLGGVADSVKELMAEVLEPVKALLGTQEEAGKIMGRARALLGPPEMQGRALNSGECSDFVGKIKDGIHLMKEVGPLAGGMSRAVDVVAEKGGVVSKICRELREVFELCKDLFSGAAVLLTSFIQILPKILKEIRDFFYPKDGLRAMVLKPSAPLLELVQGMERLIDFVPNDDDVQSKTRAFTESPSMSRAARVEEEVTQVLALPREVATMLSECQVLPERVKDATIETLQTLVQGAGQEWLAVQAEELADDFCDDLGGLVHNFKHNMGWRGLP
eukprot:CAMPEP_0206237706 /NCGR_PEP_ID=MMETSP0047_2-20121206/14410_1 /ASSEMBLY_ACC=CAM_ASM_000192 /TAXON_ID=195065 /ORGANISM="Chroomonas mesostigmatica_cf, Strain CCMP1168" /LENGTH=475 /DNA_ID=CAMNT_0053662163 /DNA_START=60 /DNA_END=1484 /DNA_ORIENTATION=-